MKYVLLLIVAFIFSACATSPDSVSAAQSRGIAQEITSARDQDENQNESGGGLRCGVNRKNGITCNEPNLRCLVFNHDNGVLCNDLSVDCTVNQKNAMVCSRNKKNVDINYERLLRMNEEVVKCHNNR